MSLHDKELQEGAESKGSGFRGSKENVLGTTGAEFCCLSETHRAHSGWKHGPTCKDDIDRAD